MHNQKGMTLIGWIGVLAILLVLALAALRLLPVYMQYFRIDSVMRDLPLQMKSESKVSQKAIKDYVGKRFDIESINVIQPDDVKIVLNTDDYTVKVEYDHKVPYVANVSFLVSFSKEVKVPR